MAKVWIAAHWDKKLTKADIRLVNLSETVVNLIQPSVPIALRTSGELMLGVVKIFSLKVRFLLQEAQASTTRLREVTIVGATANITMPPGRTSAIQAVTDAVAPEAEEYLAQQTALHLRPGLLEQTSLEQLGDLDDWTRIPEEKTFELSQLEAFPLRIDRERSPKSESSAESSSVQRLRALTTPRGAGALGAGAGLDITVQFPVEELFPPTQIQPPTPGSEAALPQPMEIEETPARPAEEPVVPMPPPPARKPKALDVDRSISLSSDLMKRRLDDTSDTIRISDTVPLDSQSLEAARVSRMDPLFRRLLPTFGLGDIPEISSQYKIWAEAVFPVHVKPAEPEEEAEETVEARKEREAREQAEAQFIAGVEEGLERPLPFEPTEEELMGPGMMAFETPELKRKAMEDLRAAKRRRLGEPSGAGGEVIDLAQTLQQTLAVVRRQCAENKPTTFSEMVLGCGRKLVATRFYDLLALKNNNVVSVNQPAPYNDITVTLKL